jgi:hypothetical protein
MAREPLKSSRILKHGNVVEQDVTRGVFFRRIQQLLQLLVAVPVAISRSLMEPKMAERASGGVLLEWVNPVHKLQLLAQFLHFLGLPFAARLPDASE